MITWFKIKLFSNKYISVKLVTHYQDLDCWFSVKFLVQAVSSTIQLLLPL